jgi:hypothetical protein
MKYFLLLILLLPSFVFGLQATTAPTTQPANAKLLEALGKAVSASGQDVTYNELMRLSKGPGEWEHIKGVLTFTNVIIVASAFFLVIALVWLTRLYLWHIMMSMGPIAHEILIYSLCAILIVLAYKLGPQRQLFFLVPSALGLFGGFYYTRYRHSFKVSEGKSNSSLLAFFTATAWAILAVCFCSQVIGFLTVLAFFVGVGFSVIVLPGVVGLGFENDDVMPRATMAAAVLLLVHIVTMISPGFMPWWYQYFGFGVAFLGTFVYFLGLLIMSNRFYSKDNWIIINIITIISGVAALYLGNVYSIPLLSGIGGTFFALYIIELYYEIPWEGAGWAWSLLGLAGILYGYAWFAQRHPQLFLWHHV